MHLSRCPRHFIRKTGGVCCQNRLATRHVFIMSHTNCFVGQAQTNTQGLHIHSGPLGHLGTPLRANLLQARNFRP